MLATTTSYPDSARGIMLRSWGQTHHAWGSWNDGPFQQKDLKHGAIAYCSKTGRVFGIIQPNQSILESDGTCWKPFYVTEKNSRVKFVSCTTDGCILLAFQRDNIAVLEVLHADGSLKHRMSLPFFKAFLGTKLNAAVQEDNNDNVLVVRVLNDASPVAVEYVLVNIRLGCVVGQPHRLDVNNHVSFVEATTGGRIIVKLFMRPSYLLFDAKDGGTLLKTWTWTDADHDTYGIHSLCAFADGRFVDVNFHNGVILYE